MNYSPLRILYFIAGLFCFILGTVGIVLPVLPTVPFYLATVFFLTKSSERLKEKFIKTKLYKKYMASYLKNRGLTMASKLRIMALASLTMGIAFVRMQAFPLVRFFIVLVWSIHIFVFLFKIKTID